MTTPNTSSSQTTPPARRPTGRVWRAFRALSDLSINIKLNLGLALLIVLTLLIVLLSGIGSSLATVDMDRTQDLRVPTALTSTSAQVNLLEMLGNIRSYLVLGDPEFRTAYNRDIVDFKRDLVRMELLSANWTNPENVRRLGELQLVFQEWSELPEQMLDLHDNPLANQPARRILIQQIHPLFDSILADITSMIEEQTQREPSTLNTTLLKDMADLQSSLISLKSILHGYMATNGDLFKSEYQDELTAHQLAWETLVDQRPSLSPDQAAILDQVAQDRESLLALPQQIFEIYEGEELPHADLFVLKTVAIPLADNMLRLLDEMTHSQQMLLQADLEASSHRLSDARQQTIVGGLAALALGLVLAVVFQRILARPILRLTNVAEQIIAGDLEAQAPVTSGDEIGRLAGTFNEMTSQLRQTLQDLGQRARDVEQRSRYLEASAEVSHAAASILDNNQLIRQVVDLILEQFELYYVGLFTVDAPGEWAVLRAGTGEAGRAMLARGHRIRIGEGMIGWSIANAQARVALEAEEDVVRKVTAELPDTRSEAAIPLRSRDRVLGALTVQHTRPGAFDPDTLAVLQIMADQVAVALDNAQLLAASQAALEAERRAYGELSREAWARLRFGSPNLGYRYGQGNVIPLGRLTPAEDRAAGDEQPAPADEELPPLTLPIKVHEHVVGTINAHKPGEWTSEEVMLVEMLSGQLSQALENARLYQATQRRAARERVTREITDNIRAATTVEGAIQRAIHEMGRVLGASELIAHIGTQQDLLSRHSQAEVNQEEESQE